MLTAVLAGHMDITNNRCTFNGGAMQPEGTPYTTCSVGKPKTDQGLAIAFTRQLVERFAP